MNFLYSETRSSTYLIRVKKFMQLYSIATVNFDSFLTLNPAEQVLVNTERNRLTAVNREDLDRLNNQLKGSSFEVSWSVSVHLITFSNSDEKNLENSKRNTQKVKLNFKFWKIWPTNTIILHTNSLVFCLNSFKKSLISNFLVISPHFYQEVDQIWNSVRDRVPRFSGIWSVWAKYAMASTQLPRGSLPSERVSVGTQLILLRERN